MASTAGQIINRGKRKWVVRVFLGRDPDTGKRRYMNKTVHGNKTDAQQVLTEMLRAKDTGTLVEPVKMSLNTLLDKWLETAVKPRVKERTYRGYVDVSKRYLRKTLGAHLITQVRPVSIQELYADMLGRGLSPRTVRHVQTVLHNCFEQAIRWQLVRVNPAQHVDLPRQSQEEMQVMSEEEAHRFLTAALGDPLHALFALLLGTGVRPSEAAALRWPDLDPQAKTLSVRRTVVRPKGGGWQYEEPKTKRGKRTIALPDGLITTLLEHRESAPPSEHDLIFPATNGEPLNVNNVRNRNFTEVRTKAGLSEAYNLYTLRHTHATLCLLAGIHPKVVSERLGHATVSITLDTYSHVLPNMQREASQKLDAMLFNRPNPDEARAPLN